MIGLFASIILFNLIAFKTNKRLTLNQIVHIWTFTIALQQTFDLLVEFKYHGYWYFGKDVEWAGLMAHTILIPPVNMLFLNWYPLNGSFIKRISFIVFFVIGILLFEAYSLLPEPWGFFHYGWWKLWHAAIVDPFLLFILLKYYKWICRLEKNLHIKNF